VKDMQNRNNCRVLMIGFTVSDSAMDVICANNPYQPIQSHKHSWSIVRGLEANGCEVDLISSLPIALFPGNRQILVLGRRWERAKSSSSVTTTFVNVIGLRHITRFLSVSLLTFIWALRQRGLPNRCIILYGLHSAHIYAARLVNTLFRLPMVCVVTDPPGTAKGSRWSPSQILRRIDAYLLKSGAKSMDGIVGVTAEIKSMLNFSGSFLLMDGIISNMDNNSESGNGIATAHSNRSDGKTVLMYAGGLPGVSGVSQLMEAFIMSKPANSELWIAGAGALEGEVRRAAASCSAIRYLGYVPADEIGAYMGQADFLINPRPADQLFTRYSFPSKLLQYMATGKPVISSRLPGITSEYWDYLIPIEDETVQGMAVLLAQVLNRKCDNCSIRGKDARAFVLQQKSEGAQGARMADLLRGVILSHH
jgi:glycosyltransferase involved in cell wall biosynthesis